MRLQLLGGLSPRTFLRRYWQKRPLFVPQALPGFGGVIDKRALAALAARDDVESRIVERRGALRDTRHGPFEKVILEKTRSTLLVSGVNLHLAAADALLRRFAFVPQARLDDVMVSYATPGGGVGPHVDSYDVFLLQGPGRRRWRVVQKEYIAHPGDLLYLPPGIEHDGVALERVLYLLDRLPRAARHRARGGVPRLAARARPARSGVPRPAPRAGVAAGAHPARNVAVQ